MATMRFTERAQDALAAAQRLAETGQHAQVDAEHLLAALLDQAEGLAGTVLQSLRVQPASLRRQLQTELDRLPNIRGGELYMSARLRSALRRAQDEAERLKDEYVSVEHLLLGIAGEPERDAGPASRLLKAAGATVERLYQGLADRTSVV